jgi:hypothetical protein
MLRSIRLLLNIPEKGEIPSEAQKSQLEKMIELIEAAIKVIDEAHIEEMPDGK